MEQYNSIQQILKKENGHDRKPIYPPTVIQAVFDAKTGASLEAILAQFNSIYVQYQGSPQATRNIIPVEMRRAGLMITYMNMDSETITEKASSAVQKDNDHWGLDVNWSRVDELSLSGDIAVSANGTWIINGVDTKVPARGSKGDAGLTPWLKTIDNKLHYSYDNTTWEPCSDYLAGYFRFNATSSDSQAGTIGKIQVSKDNKTWTDLSPEFRNYLRIQGYVASTSALPIGKPVGTIYGVGPTYDAADTAHTNPIYHIHVFDGAKWVDNGTFTSIAAGVVQETGDSETDVMSQKAVTEKLTELGSEVDKLRNSIHDLEPGINESQLKDYLEANDYAKKDAIPSKVSSFENDANYITKKELENYRPNTSVETDVVIDLDSDEICDYYAIGNKGEVVSATGYGCTSFIPCYGCIEMSITKMQLTSAKSYGIAFYDNNKNFLSYVPSLVGSKNASVMEEVQVPSAAHYFKATFFNYETQKTVGAFKCIMRFNDESLYTKDGKRPYQEGCIYYSQRVNQSITPYWSESQDIAVGDNKKVTTGVLTLPTNYNKTGKKVPLILYAHGLSHYVYYGQWGAIDRPEFMVQKQHWLDMGFAIMDCNGARDNNKKGQFASGICPQGVNAYKLCLEYVLKNYNIDEEIFIVAGSAGGAIGWNFLSMYGKCVKAAVFISAYANMKADAYGGGNQKNLYVEYLGFDNASIFEDEKTIGFDPALKLVTINNKKYCFDYYNTPIYGLYGSLDTYALITSHKNMFAALRNAGATAQLRKINDVGHEIVSGGNIAVDTEVGNWLLSHFRDTGKNVDVIYHTVTYKYIDENGTTIKDSVTSNVIEGVTIDFTVNAPTIVGYNYASVSPTNATITSDIVVTYTYNKIDTYTITYKYVDANGVTIKEDTTEQVNEGTNKNFAVNVPSIEGYEFTSVEPSDATINGNLVVTYTYTEQEQGGEDIVGNDLSSLFTFDRKNWMCVINPQFKTSSYFDSCYTDLSAYIGKTIRITVPQYTASNGSSSTGVTFWAATPTEQPSAFNTSNLIKQWDTHTAGNAKGILVEVETVVPADAPYLWTSTYNSNAVSLGVYVGENDGYTDFKCYIVE